MLKLAGISRRSICQADGLLEWSKVVTNISQCNHVTVKPATEIKDEKESAYYKWGQDKFAYDILASDKIGPRRSLPPVYHPLCHNISREGITLQASIVIIYHNEALSVLIRMVNSILDRTPTKYLKEIILYDDYSHDDCIIKDKLLEYGLIANWPLNRMTITRGDKREGLIRARMAAAEFASGDVLIFLDSHCEVTDKWIEPLLQTIQEDRTRVVLPVVDLINPVKFEYSQAMIAKMSFDWRLAFNWVYFPWEYFDIPENNFKPFKTPMMSGGLFAVNRKYFYEMGGYDTGMETWGGENIEMSLRIWLCGGSVLVNPCSHVGHIFRMRRPYQSKSGLDTNLYNSLRAVKVWFDDYQKYFYVKRPDAKKMDVGDLSARLELKKKLKCKPFKYFIDEVDPSMTPKERLDDEL
uniref:Glyco_trans_2-like domain-containing protein n=1 Tax=Syphacia muris TaxID=451379 RepID=A0A0N5ADP8_9BILA